MREPVGFPFEAWLQPGEYAIGRAGCRLSTLLGSCVSITLWHPRLQVGAMSHFLLWSRVRGADQAMDGRYGEEVVPMMFKALADAQVPVAECQAKIFGGGNMFPEVANRRNTKTVGEQNGLAARLALQRMNVDVVSECLFGNGRRTVVFDVDSGHVWVRQVTGQVPGLMAG